MPVYRLHDLVLGLRTGNRKQLWKARIDHFSSGAETAGDDHPTVFLQRFIDGIERFFDRGIDEATGIDNNHVGGIEIGHDVITLDAQLGNNLFRINAGLGTAEADEANPGHICRHCRPNQCVKDPLSGDQETIDGCSLRADCEAGGNQK